MRSGQNKLSLLIDNNFCSGVRFEIWTIVEDLVWARIKTPINRVTTQVADTVYLSAESLFWKKL